MYNKQNIGVFFGNENLKGSYIDLDQEARNTFNIFEEKENPLLDPQFCEDWVKYLNRKKNVDFTYGGYMEDRSFLWRNSYLSNKGFGSFIHLGVDINYFANHDYVGLCSPQKGKLLDLIEDKDQNGGWGTRLTIEYDKGIVVFAHLQSNRVYSEIIKKNEYLQLLGEYFNNGGWYKHLHIQGLADIKLLKNLDGYADGNKYSIKELKKMYPNPLEILNLK